MDVFETHIGKSPIIFNGAHNGYAVPSELYIDDKPLGLNPAFFNPNKPERKHEACDWGIHALMAQLKIIMPDASFLEAHISRLVVDLNRAPSHMVSKQLSEHGEDVPLNVDISDEHEQKRYDAYYKPYHDQLDNIVQAARKADPHPFIIDLHSFSPSWHGEERPEIIGSLCLHDDFFENQLNQNLSEAFGQSYKPNYPYSLHDPILRKTCATDCMHTRNDYIPIGVIEIRNDVLQNEAQIKNIADKIAAISHHLINIRESFT